MIKEEETELENGVQLSKEERDKCSHVIKYKFGREGNRERLLMYDWCCKCGEISKSKRDSRFML